MLQEKNRDRTKADFDLLSRRLLGLLLVLGLSWFVTSAHATPLALEVEPYVGAAGWGHIKMNQGTAHLSQSGNPSYPPLETYDFSECIGLGLRVGAVLEGTYYVSLDFVQFPKITTSNPLAPSWSNTQFGLTGGAQLPSVPMRFWIGFNLIHSITANRYLENFGISGPVSLQGTSFKMGTGVQIYSPIWLNFEMVYGQLLNYSNPSSHPVPTSVSNSYNYFFLSLSTPIRWLRI
jgi:hypothetical protein